MSSYIYFFKVFTALSLSLFLVASCKTHKNDSQDDKKARESVISKRNNFPEHLNEIFQAHGGFENWDIMQSLGFSIPKDNDIETTQIDLNTRNELIEHPDYTIGYNGEALWLCNKSGKSYKGNARFYKGLMFYFFAMPFVLGDNGIIYSEAPPIKFEGNTYPGILISYNSGVGESPEDQYIIYYNAKTFQMQWLAYTVTFGKNIKSKDFHFIRYKDWQETNGLKLPHSISWYTYKDNLPQELRSTIKFTDVIVSRVKWDSQIFNTPQDALIID